MMGVIMEGEKLHSEHRRRFWRNLMIVGIGALPIGFAIGFGAGHRGGDFDAFLTSAPDWQVIALLGLAVGGVIYGSWRFYRSIDELELLDNLWASSAAYSAYSLLFPIWWILSRAGIAVEPNQWLIFMVALGGGLATYLARKWRAR